MLTRMRAEVEPEDQASVDALLREYNRLEALLPGLARLAEPEPADLEGPEQIRSYIGSLELIAAKMDEVIYAMDDATEELEYLGWGTGDEDEDEDEDED